mmetsp:Transcript_19077/g.38709  ORF Transcript_19077/g.38709 Transcript_19077/m.38709 type:complete len:108 (-) Transcript_19077:646-969(-)
MLSFVSVASTTRHGIHAWTDANGECLQMDSVAKRFGLSVERLLDFNADLVGMSEEDFAEEERVCPCLPYSCWCSPACFHDGLSFVQHLCIIPNSCSLEAPPNSDKNE